MPDGSVKIDVGLSTNQAEKELAKLRAKIEKTEAALNANASRKTALLEQIAAVGAQADVAKVKVLELKQQLSETSNRSEKASIRAELAEATEEQRILVRESNSLNDEYVKVSDSIEQGTADLETMKDEAGQLTRQIERERPGEILAQGFEMAKKSLWKFIKYAFGIRSVFILFRRLKSYIKESVQTAAEYDKELKMQLATLNATKTAIKGTFGAAFANIFQALLPMIQRVTNWILEAANAASRFVAIVSGKDSYKRAVVDTEEVAASLEDTSDAADDVTDSVKEAKKALMGFDELNILNTSDTSGSSGKTKKEKTDKTALDGIKYVTESLEKMGDSLFDKFAISVKDVFFDWSDLNPEQIAKKVIAGLGLVLGLALGLTLGLGPGGVIMLTLAGIAFGLLIDSLIFDNDGVLSREEIASMLKLALGALCGGIIGFAVTGNLAGALIGATIGIGIELMVLSILPKDGESGDLGLIGTLVELLNAALPIAASTALGAVIGGPGGAAIGFILGIGISLMIAEVDTIPGGGKDLLQKMIKLLNTDTVRAGIEFLSNPVGGLVNANIRLALKFMTSDNDDLSSESREAGEQAGDSLQSGMETGVTRTRRDWGAIFRNIFGSAKTEATQTGNEIGRAVTDGEAAGLESGTQDVVTSATTMDSTVQDQMREDWDTGSPSKVTEDLGKDIDAGLAEGFEAGTPDVVAASHSMFEKIIEDMRANLEKMKALMNFKWSIPKPAIPRISWSFSTVRYGKGQSVSVPQFFVNWYAKGGIFDFPQLIGVGENGKEAVVPLEKNTEWMAKIADGLMDRLTQANFVDQLVAAFASTPMPAMAGGSIVPPNATQAGAFSPDGMADAVRRGVYEAIMAMGGMPRSRGGFSLNVNGREFMRATYDDRVAVDQEHGMSLIET